MEAIQRNNRFRFFLVMAWLISVSFVSLMGVHSAQAETGAAASESGSSATVFEDGVVIPVEQGIERGLEAFLQRAFDEAKQRGADLAILDIDTPGGEINAATHIGALIRQAPMHVVAYIDDQAFSAGTYIALNADEIVMTPGSAIGAATPIDMAGNAADVKVISAWSEKMQSAARLNRRDEQIARAMVEIDMEIPGLKEKGTVLSLDAEKAAEVGYADKIVADKAELYRYLGIEADRMSNIEPTLSERVARFVTSPYVMSLLLLIGLLGLIVELFVPGFGVAGTVGLLSFGLYFFGHYVAGFADWLHIGLFVLGVVLMLAEIVLPGGIVGIIGFVSLSSSLVLAAYDTEQGLVSLAFAALVTVIAAIWLVKRYGFKGLISKFVLSDELRSEAGYIAPRDQRELIGQVGIALTPLRPSGIVRIDGKRVDAVSAGGFIASGTEVVVIQVEGTRVVVEERENEKKE
ncbi:nodulation protein NfeD [Brevibacillus humidisoli]|uniref:NfeD family protein n=1 Tax=Brevibacillus humidisoli TaxID=2895522 RepID=UPI001E629C8A|nr:NfeD family protein [Brevibacillus humidisoli]UFJ43155.1 nodulation protein NfeD [Brevibacillus humidisoli]